MIRFIRSFAAGIDGARSRLVGAILLAAAASGASVALLGTSAWLLSRAAEMPPLMYLNVAIVGVRFFGISRGGFRYAERLLGHDIALRMQSALRLGVYDKLAHTTLLGRRRGDLLARVILDVEAIMDLMVRVLIPFASASVVMVGTTVILGVFSPLNAAVLLLTAVCAGVLIPWLAQRMSAAADESAAPLRGELASQVQEMNRTAIDVVAYGAQDRVQTALLATDRKLRDVDAKAAWVRGVAVATQIAATGVAVLAALIIGGQAIADGTLKPRLLAVLVLVPLALHEVLADLTQAAQTFTRSRSALSRVQAVVNAEPIGSGDRPDSTATSSPLVRLDDVSIGWPGAEPLVENISLTVSAGQRLAITGPSGSGKTTLAATIMGFIPAQAGTVEVAGRIGYLAQDAHIFATTLAENVRVANKDATDEQIVDALRRAGLDSDPQREVGELGATLSGGEMRRLALARLLVGTFDVWILDEPTEHLDVETAENLMKRVWAELGNAPVICLTHDPVLIQQCNQVRPFTN